MYCRCVRNIRVYSAYEERASGSLTRQLYNPRALNKAKLFLVMMYIQYVHIHSTERPPLNCFFDPPCPATKKLAYTGCRDQHFRQTFERLIR